VTISYYAHAWQAFLMFLAGLVSVLAAFAGYVTTGGAEEIFRRALAVGETHYDTHDFNWRDGEMVVKSISKKPFIWPAGADTASFKGLTAREMRVKMDLFPWPPKVTSITVLGMPETEISVSDGFLQSGQLRQSSMPDLPTINFRECDLKLNIGSLAPLVLKGCSGELRRGPSNEMKGNFSLSELNGKPFRFKLETLEDGRWIFTGDNIQINTREALTGQTKLFAEKLDPVSFLVRALFSGEMGAEGMVSSLRIVVQPATDRQKFTCDGEVGYKNLILRLPPSDKEAAVAVPAFLDKLLGTDGWPRWMQVDQIRTGQSGRVNFHMTDGVLNFSCDEGAGSAFTGSKQGKEFLPLESLKGSVETDIEGKPRRITLRGFLGHELSFETRIERNIDKSRTYELVLEPRSGDAASVVFGKPLWRFVSRVKDYWGVDRNSEAGAALPLADFELEGDARHFPITDWLPPGMQDLSGHMYAKGRFTTDLKLKFDSIVLDDGGAIIYGGADLKKASDEKSSQFAPLWKAAQAFFGTDTPWTLQDLSMQGEAEAQFNTDLSWESTTLKNWTLTTGSLLHGGLTTDVGVARIQLSAFHKSRGPKSNMEVSAFVPNLWTLKFSGAWEGDKSPNNVFTLYEDVPLVLHPQRETLDRVYITDDKRRVNRVTTLRVKEDGKVEREVKP
jgi:hypothetical protein